jgi:hypothetical protein
MEDWKKGWLPLPNPALDTPEMKAKIKILLERT